MPFDHPSHEANLADSLHTVAVNSSYTASRALSKWLKTGVQLSTDGFVSLALDDCCRSIHDVDEPIAAVRLPMLGDVKGDILLAFPEKQGLALVDMLIGAPNGTSKEFSEMEASCLQETGNIVASAFANSLSSWLKMTVTPQAPEFAFDLAAALIDPLLETYAQSGDDAFVAKTVFEVAGRKLDWSFLFLPTPESLDAIRKRCGQDEVQRHALRTIAVNAAFDASRSLSKWLRRGVQLQTEGFVKTSFHDVVPDHDTLQPVVAMYSALEADLHGHALTLLDLKTGLALVDVLSGKPKGTTKIPLDEMGISCLQETCNILSSSFANAWAKYLEISIIAGPPHVLVDLPQAVIQSVLAEQMAASDDVFLARTRFRMDQESMDWQFLVVPSPASLRLFEAFDVETVSS
jgi:chemotaxis protein CheC